jgi:N utilization substance protein A
MNKELLLVIETVANEKGISKDNLFTAVEEALKIAAIRRFNAGVKIRVSIDRRNGLYSVFRQWLVVSEDFLMDNNNAKIYADIAKKEANCLPLNNILEAKLDSIKFGRIAATMARQVIIQKVREAEQSLIIEKFKEKIGFLVYGQVIHVTRELLVIDIGDGARGVIRRSELLPKENYRVNDRLRACIIKIDHYAKNYQIILSRVDRRMLLALLSIEVPEISEGSMHVVSAVRDPGYRAKIAVKADDKRIDPVGSCVGIRGSRIQAITEELQGERIDIIVWDDNPVQYAINAISPAEVISVAQDNSTKVMELVVKDEQLSLAIGKNGKMFAWHQC